MEQIATLTVDEVIEPAQNGMTKPYLCRLSDDAIYFVKGRNATTKGLISEVVCGALGRAFGLPIPPFSLAYVEGGLIDHDPELRLSLGRGWAFASSYQIGLVELTQKALLKKDSALLRKLFLFDNWIMNADRTGTDYAGNANLFRRTANDELCILDHNLAFAPDFTVEENLQSHIARGFWNTDLLGPLARNDFTGDMELALSDINGFSHALPDEWIEANPEFCGAIEQHLIRFRSVDFWNELK